MSTNHHDHSTNETPNHKRKGRLPSKNSGNAASGKKVKSSAPSSKKNKTPRLGKNGKGGKKTSRERSIKFKVFVSLFVLFFICLVGGLGFLGYEISKTPDLDLNNFNYLESSTILDKNGAYYQSLQGLENRESVTIDQIPAQVQNAFVSIEDQRFWSHNGIDIQRLGRAVIEAFFSAGLEGPGGSTITQQLIKLTHLTSDKTIERKIQEMVLASRLEKVYTKQQILESYLNKINLSEAWGVQSASKKYFGKNVWEIDIAQSAIIASIANSPSYYDPYTYTTDEAGNFFFVREEDGRLALNEHNRDRSLNVIAKMYELGYIHQDEYEQAKAALENNQVGLIYNDTEYEYSYFTDSVYSEIIDDLMEKKGYTEAQATDILLNQGITIHSTVDPQIQNIMEAASKDEDLFPDRSYASIQASEIKSAETGETHDYIPQVGMTVIDNATGSVAGIVGGREEKTNLSLNRALRQFQPGSSIKPLTVYAPGLNNNYFTLGSIFDDTAIRYDNWEPKNSSGSFAGAITVREALRTSSNVVAVTASLTTGMTTSASYAEQLGLVVDDEDRRPAALALGGFTNGQTSLAMASAYATFPNEGRYKEPSFYTKVLDRDGNVLLENTDEAVQVFKAETAYLITDVLKEVVSGGTTNIYVAGQEVAGKTGTTDNNRHAWFCGYTNAYSMAVWYGYDENVVETSQDSFYLNIDIFGGSKPGPAGMFESVMNSVSETTPAASLPERPASIVDVKIDKVSGHLATNLTERDPRGNMAITEKFVTGTSPMSADPSHVEVTLDTSTNCHPNAFCPQNLVQPVIRLNQVATALPTGVTLVDPNYKRVPDELLVPPTTQICTVHTQPTPSPSPTANRIIIPNQSNAPNPIGNNP